MVMVRIMFLVMFEPDREGSCKIGFVAMINVFHNCRAQSFWLRKAFVLKSLARHKGGLNQRS